MMEQQEPKENTWLKVQVPSSLHHDLKVLSAREMRSLKSQVTKILSDYLQWYRSSEKQG